MFRRIIRIFVICIIAAALAVFGLSAFVALSEKHDIAFTNDGSGEAEEAAASLASFEPQCIMVLGCAVWADNQPSPMLKDRLDTAVELYKNGAAPKLLLTGDNREAHYNEPECMLQYVLGKGVPAEDIFLDYAGFSTYDSVYRAKAVFCVERMIVVTQTYHLFRALKICDALGIEAKGAASDQRKYTGRYIREAREVLARDKDFFKGIFRPEPVFLGDEIPITGEGNAVLTGL